MSETLSALIRAGAQLRPQAFGRFFAETETGLTSCALGAAYEAATGRTTYDESEEVVEAIETVTGLELSAYQERLGGVALQPWIVERNDAGVPRETIAAELEAIGL